MYETKRAGTSLPFDDGGCGFVPRPRDIEIAGNRGKAIGPIGVVIGRHQGVGARVQLNPIFLLPIGIGLSDCRDQAGDVPSATMERLRLDRSSGRQGHPEGNTF